METGLIKKIIPAGQLKVGDFVLIRGRPCKIIAISKSKTGKHGSSKIHVTFDDNNSELMLSAESVELQM